MTLFTWAPGGHAREDRVDAMVWPIDKHVVKMRRNVGASGDMHPSDDSAE